MFADFQYILLLDNNTKNMHKIMSWSVLFIIFDLVLLSAGAFNYEGCGETKSCFRWGEHGCDEDTCEYTATWMVKNNMAHIEMSAKLKADNGYAAFGFSVDGQMANADVYACKNFNGKASIEHWHNPPAQSGRRHIPSEKVENNPVKAKYVKYQDGRIMCAFSRHLTKDTSQYTFDLSKSWYQLYVHGPTDNGGRLDEHYEEHPPTSGKKQRLKVIENHNLWTTAGSAHRTASVLGVVLIVISTATVI